VIDAVEEFSYITLQGKTRIRNVFTHDPEYLRQMFHALVRTLANSARKRSRNEGWLENRIKHFEYRMVENSISHRRFMYAAQFRVVKQEHSIWSMAIVFGPQFATELKDFVLNIFLKCFHILPIPLIAFENVPCLEQIFCRDYSII